MRTERILLRRFVNADAARLAAVIFAEADVMKTLIGDASTAERQLALAHAWIERWGRCWDEHGYGVWAIELADASLGAVGTLIGFTGYEAPVLAGEDGPEGIIGRGTAYWNQGIAKEMRITKTHLFANTDIPSLHGLVFSEVNPIAVRLAERAGLTHVGRVPIHARVGPTYQADTLRFELHRVLLARPGREREALDLAAFRAGQLLGCRAADPDALGAEARARAPEPLRADVAAAFAKGFGETSTGDDEAALGTAWLDLLVERQLKRIVQAAPGAPEPAQRAAFELGRAAATVQRDVMRARVTLVDNAMRRGLDDVEGRVREQLTAGLALPTMEHFRITRAEHERGERERAP